MRLLLVFSLLVGTACAEARDPQLPNPAIDVEHYVFRLTLSDQTDAIAGEATLTVRFRSGAPILSLDFDDVGGGGMTVTRVLLDGQELRSYRHEMDRLWIRLPDPPRAGAVHRFTVAYNGTPEDGLIIGQNKYGERTFFGDNWPNRAHYWLPTVDHPADKATVEFLVTAPNHYQVVGSGAKVEETDLPDGLRLTHWRSDVPLATKVMVIGAARFAVQQVGTVGDVPVESWVYPQDRDKGFFDFARAERILRFFEGHIGPFPYQKLANVQSKTKYGGMENASNIFYHENAVKGDRSNETLLAHEIAHQWFGDSVTEADWPHIWLSEGFATYFTHLYLEFTYGRDRLVAGMQRDRMAILGYYAQAPDDAILDTTLTDLNDLLSPNTYQKAGWVLHMLRHQVGDEAFWDGVRRYYQQYRDRNALTRDFQQAVEAASGQDLSAFFQQWLSQPGHPHLVGDWQYHARTKQLTVTLRQTQPRRFEVSLEVGIQVGTAPLRLETLRLDQAEHTFTFDVETRPDTVVLDPHTWLLMEATFGPKR